MPTAREKLIACAVHYVGRFGLSVIPMSKEKKPAAQWKEFQSRRPTVNDILNWPEWTYCIAIVTGSISNLVVVDCESEEDAKWFWRERGSSKTVVKTRRGYHLYFRHPGEPVANAQKVENRYDVRGDGGYVLAPPSRHAEGTYSFRTPFTGTADLPEFNPSWRPPTIAAGSDKKISDGEKYIRSIVAVAGQRGHDTTYRAACSLRDSGLSEGEALLVLQRWNQTNANPPWSDAELLHKIRSAYA